jgi:tRNA (guanine-N7-)-methyltransferase
MNKATLPKRAVRSFVRRQGRMSTLQRQALTSCAGNYELPVSPEQLDLTQVFGRNAPRVLEIGFGNGAGFVAMAKQHPQQDFLGVEVHRPGIANVFLQAQEWQLQNVRVINADATEVLAQQLPDACLDAIYIFFPDPWHKQKHRKRRLIQPAFVELLAGKLRGNGVLHLATDWEDYAQQMLKVIDANPCLRNLAGPGQFSARPQWRPLTKYEQRGQRQGHVVRDLLFLRI